MTDIEVRRRAVSRVLLLNEHDSLFLFDTRLAYTRAWVAPGGGVEPGETHEDGALRELEEETGVRGVELSPCIWEVHFRFARGGAIYDQRERYFVARVASFEIDTSRWTESEAGQILGHRWWSADEIARARADFRPANLAELLPEILAGRLPAPPLRAPVERAARTV